MKLCKKKKKKSLFIEENKFPQRPPFVILVISVKAKGRRKITYELRTCLYMGGGQTQKYFFYTLKMHSTLKH